MKEYKEQPTWARGQKYSDWCPHEDIIGGPQVCRGCLEYRVKNFKR